MSNPADKALLQQWGLGKNLEFMNRPQTRAKDESCYFKFGPVESSINDSFCISLSDGESAFNGLKTTNSGFQLDIT